MAERIDYSELERLLADDATPDEVLAAYLKPAPLRALAPVMIRRLAFPAAACVVV